MLECPLSQAWAKTDWTLKILHIYGLQTTFGTERLPKCLMREFKSSSVDSCCFRWTKSSSSSSQSSSSSTLPPAEVDWLTDSSCLPCGRSSGQCLPSRQCLSLACGAATQRLNENSVSERRPRPAATQWLSACLRQTESRRHSAARHRTRDWSFLAAGVSVCVDVRLLQ